MGQDKNRSRPLVAIACGGTGGHLFPGLAVAETLQQRGYDVVLLISTKEVDQWAVRGLQHFPTVPLPAIGLTKGQRLGFVLGFFKAFSICLREFKQRRPLAVLSMGGFIGAPALVAAKMCGAHVFIHESNVIPGRANRRLARLADRVFVGFSAAAPRFDHTQVFVTGTPVRSQFEPADEASCRQALGLAPDAPVLLIQGGSQGAHALNTLLIQALPTLKEQAPELQYLHLTGPHDSIDLEAAYQEHGCRARVLPFLTEMELALGSATLALSRAGASSLAELTAMQVPAILIPYPRAVDNHQYWNAQTLADNGAAILLPEDQASGTRLAEAIVDLLHHPEQPARMREALSKWRAPHAAALILEKMLPFLPETQVHQTAAAF